MFNKKDPIVVGVDVVEGIAKVGTPLAVPTQAGIELGRIASLELNHKAVDVARAGQSVAMKIEACKWPTVHFCKQAVWEQLIGPVDLLPDYSLCEVACGTGCSSANVTRVIWASPQRWCLLPGNFPFRQC